MLKLEKFLFYLFLFCLPFGTRKIVWQWGNGFNEWTSAYLYLTDILLGLIFFCWFWRKRKERFLKNIKPKWGGVKSPFFWLILFLTVCFISLVKADNFWLGFYHWLRLLELSLLFLYARRFMLKRNAAWILVSSGLFQAVVAILQFGNQAALGLRWLGESPIAVEIDGVAKIAAGGIKMVRAYGTLPHPNVLAAFLFLCLFCLYYLCLKLTSQDCSLRITSLFIASYFLLVAGLFLTFSRLVIALFIASSLFCFSFLLWQTRKAKDQLVFKRIICILLLVSACWLLITALVWPEFSSRFNMSLGEQSVSLRSFYNKLALALIGRAPLLGLGLGNFVREVEKVLDLMPDWIHQPVHNLYLLIAAETGLIGLAFFLMFLFKVISCSGLAAKLWRTGGLWVILTVIGCWLLIAGFFDHYFWTIWQGQLLFWLSLGLICSANELK